MSKVGSFFGTLWTKMVRPALKLGKPYLRSWAKNKLIPELQKKVNAGAIDAVIDESMEKIILSLIDEI